MIQKKLKKKITNRTSGTIVVSLFGQIPNVKELLKIKKKYNLTIIEDASPKFSGPKYKSKKSCNIFDITVGLAFFLQKSLRCFGDGRAFYLLIIDY